MCCVYLDAVVAMTVMRVILCVLHVGMVGECEGDINAGMGDGEGVVIVSAWHEYVGGTPDSADMLGMCVVRGMRGVSGVCEMCMCLARGGVRGEGVSG